jgi:transposase
MRTRRQTVEHVFGTIKGWMGATHFRIRRVKNVATEMSLQVLVRNLKRVIANFGTGPLVTALHA